MFTTLITFTLVWSLHGAVNTFTQTFEAPIQEYGRACHRGLGEYRDELKRYGGSLVSFECSEGVLRK